MSARFIVGDVFETMAKLPDGSVDLVLTSPPIQPFLALRSYLPAGHPDKGREIGSESTPAAFLDTLLHLTAEWGRVLAPHGSLCVELGDTYCVDEETEILTQRGWLSVDDLNVGDIALTLNPETRLAEWQAVDAVNRFPATPRLMLRMEGDRGHSSLTTPNHRWLTEHRTTTMGVGTSRRGEHNGFATLRQEDVDAIRSRYAGGGTTQQALAAEFGVTQPAISKIVTGRTWVSMPVTSDPSRSWLTRERRSDSLADEDRVPVAAQVANLPTEPKWSDALVEAVAWYWTEGNDRSRYGKARGLWFCQSERVNPANCDRIRRCLTSIFGPPVERLRGRSRWATTGPEPQWREERPRGTGVIDWKLNGAAADVIRQHAPDKVVRAEWLAELTQAQLDLFVSVSVAADGHERGNEISLCQSNMGDNSAMARRRAEAFQVAAILSGRYATLRCIVQDAGPRWCVHVGPKRFFRPARTRREWVEFDGMVWCPTTANGSWLARRGGAPFFTGNSGSGGAGGDYDPEGLRAGQQAFAGSAAAERVTKKYGRVQRDGLPPIINRNGKTQGGGSGWPLDKSLTGIPTLYAWSLAYGRNLLTGEESPAGMWRVRNVKPWIRSNPPVGALGDKERPSTSYVIVATRARDRWFDLDAVRVKNGHPHHTDNRGGHLRDGIPGRTGQVMNPVDEHGNRIQENPAGAPPRDWWHEVDAVIDAEIDRRAGTTSQEGGSGPGRRSKLHGGAEGDDLVDKASTTVGARGVHIRRALEAAGIIRTAEALDISPKGYKGSHYAVWPPELCALLIEEMCPRRVCTTCGAPSRRMVDAERHGSERDPSPADKAMQDTMGTRRGWGTNTVGTGTTRVTAGWSACGCEGADGIRLDGWHTGSGWRPGIVLDPFAGSGTTLAVATGMSRHAIGIDLDARNADLARERVGMFLDVEEQTA